MADPIILQKIRTEVPNPRQIEFFNSSARHTGYGGARGGGKSWAMRRKFCLLAVNYTGLKLLLMRRTLPELRENHTIQLKMELTGFAKYNADENAFTFPNGSRLKLGYCDLEDDVYQYQGQEYDVIGLEEATRFTDSQRQFITTCNRSTRADFKPRMYYTANPGGVGHAWFKRLFIDKQYQNDERAEDYAFIPAKVYDNKVLMETNPEYISHLRNLPEDMRRAHLDGDWDVFAGQYFPEFRREIHIIKPFKIPTGWNRYLAIDYGLDMLAGYAIATDERGRAYVYRETYEPNLRISAAAAKLKEDSENDSLNGSEEFYTMLAPPDLFNRRQETGRSAAEIFADNGIELTRSLNDRVQGWYDLKEWLAPFEDETFVTEANPKGRTANLLIFDTCANLIRCLPQLQHDDRDPNDVSATPHEISHGPDALRYFITGRPVASEAARGSRTKWEDDQWDDYENASDAQRARMIERWGNPF
jgi:phage terminase large subunit